MLGVCEMSTNLFHPIILKSSSNKISVKVRWMHEYKAERDIGVELNAWMRTLNVISKRMIATKIRT